jgi:outer membrane immunogenic protein
LGGQHRIGDDLQFLCREMAAAPADFRVDVGDTGTLDTTGVIGGGLAGYNFLVGNLLIGGEGDFSFSNADDRDPSVGGPGQLAGELKETASIRIRIGWTFDDFMAYATGGGGFADFVQPAGRFGSPEESHFGWTAGAGAEWAAIKGRNVSMLVRGEYLYGDYGDQTYDYSAGRGGTINTDLQSHIVRAAVIIKFDLFNYRHSSPTN